MQRDHLITHFHLFCGAGGGALGFQQGEARVGPLRARFECLGGIDNDPGAVQDFGRLVGVPATCLDLFDEEQHRAFHGRGPGEGWRAAQADDLRRAAQGRRPDIVFLSPPCKGFSGLLSGATSALPRYQALNQLVLRGLMLAMEAWGDDPPALLLLENVPRIAQRGRALLDQVRGLLEGHGYAVAETAHDCGEIGGLAQHRRRFLLVARHKAKVPAFLYEPPRRRVRAIGEVLGDLPVPGGSAGGPMHALPQLRWDTWVRLALIPAGKDWRALRGLDAGRYRLVSYGEHAKMRVEPWTEPAHTVTGSDRVGSGAPSVADPRWGEYQQYGVKAWDEPAGAVTAQAAAGSGPFNVADPRWRSDVLGVRPWDEPSGTVTGRASPTTGVFSVADPRLKEGRFCNIYRVVRWEDPCPTVTSGSRPAGGGMSVADPRPWDNAGHYGVIPWTEPSGAVTASAGPDNGRGSVADPRAAGNTPRIISLDGTWHRPLTTLDLAAIQGFPVEDLVLCGNSQSRWRERIGNAVPPKAAQAIAGVMGQVLLLAATGQTFALSSTPIWVRPFTTALSIDIP